MKNKLRLLTLMVPLAMLSMVSAGFASVNDTDASGESEEPYPYISPTPGEFPIIAWGLYYDTSYTIFKDLMDCGFNAAIVNSGSHCQALIPALNPVAGKDTIKVKLIPWLGWYAVNKEPAQMPGYIDGILDDYQKYAKRGNKTPIAGWMLQDEPAYYEFDHHVPYFHAVAQHDTTRMAWQNLYGDPKAKSCFFRPPLHPNMDSKGPDKILSKAVVTPLNPGTQSMYATFREYIEDYCKKFRPGVLSYDYYPFVVDTAGNDITIKKDRLHDFYTALQQYSDISKKRSRPFWAFCQCRATCIDSLYKNPREGHPAPTEDFLRYEAFNALAFGAQGIEYWSYKEQDVPTQKPDDGRYYALVTKEGEKTPAWYFAQSVNKEIRLLTKVFLGARLESYYFVGDPQGTSFKDYKIGSNSDAVFVKCNDSRADAKGSNLGALVSTLVKGNNHYVVIVNQSPYENAELLLTFNTSKYRIERIQRIGDVLVSHPINSWNTSSTMSLSRAQYLIYKYEPRLPSLPNPGQ